LTDWTTRFTAEVGLSDPPQDAGGLVDRYTRDGRLWVWEDGTVRSMAGWSGGTPTGVRLNMVYTPAPDRGRGYSKALTAAVCRDLLAAGRRHVFLFADSANPVSNLVYEKVGFRFTADWRVLRFEAAGYDGPSPRGRDEVRR
jgi:predicted GNAT family acetyltransferase